MKTYTKALLTALAIAGLSLSASAATISVIDEGLNNTGNNSNIRDSANNGKAVNFIMAAGTDYTLANVVLGLGGFDGIDDGLPIAQIWSDEAGTTPLASLLETLTNPVTLTNGANTFTSSGLTLEASTTYWVVVTGGNANQFQWVGGTDTAVTSAIGATHNGRIFPSGAQADPADWSGGPSGVLNQIQVNAVPEPGSLALLGLGGLMMIARRRRA